MLTPVENPVPTYNNVKDVISSHSVDTISRFLFYVLQLKFLHIATLMYNMDNKFEDKYQLKPNLLTPEAFDWITWSSSADWVYSGTGEHQTLRNALKNT